jgi:hypothetical protein
MSKFARLGSERRNKMLLEHDLVITAACFASFRPGLTAVLSDPCEWSGLVWPVPF